MAKKKDDSKEKTECPDLESEKKKTNPDEDKKDQDEGNQSELDKTKEQLLRVTAEYSNFRKRSEKEKSETYSYATAKTVEEFLAVVDNLERALQSEQEDYEALKAGVRMTYDGLQTSLTKLGVTVFGEPGEQFDPNLHHAVMHIEDDDLEDNVITDVFQKGYKINDKIIRPAMVKTAN